MKKIVPLLTLLLPGGIDSPSAFAGDPSGYLEEQRKLAPEILRIRVDRVEQAIKWRRIEGCGNVGLELNPACFYLREEIRLAATILEVTRSKSESKRGQSITVSYGDPIGGETPACAPYPTPVLKLGKTYSAYLSTMPKGGYVPHVPGPVSFGISGEEAHLLREEARRVRTFQMGLWLLLAAGAIAGFRYRTRLPVAFRRDKQW